MNVEQHAEAILRAACGQPFGTLQLPHGRYQGVLAAVEAYGVACAEAMKEAGAQICDERGAEEQEGFGLNRAAQNYFRARNAVRGIDAAEIVRGMA